MSNPTGSVAVSDVITAIVTTGEEDDGILIQNHGPFPVYVGFGTIGADPTSTNGGILLSPGANVTLSTSGSPYDHRQISGITALGTSYVSYAAVLVS